MNHHNPTLMDILQPRSFQSNPMRERATRKILQPEIDRFEQQEQALAQRARSITPGSSHDIALASTPSGTTVEMNLAHH